MSPLCFRIKTERRKMMGVSERRNKILKILYTRRYDTIGNLAFEFNVSERTIRRDIETLSLTEPIYTQSGRYGGGVYVMDGYYGNQATVSNEEFVLLNKIDSMADSQLRNVLSVNEHETLKNMVAKYSKTSKKDKNKMNE